MKISDRYLRVMAPLVVQAARATPHPLLDEMARDLSSVAARRGLRSLLADLERVAAGGAVQLPVLPDIRRDPQGSELERK